MRTSVTAATLVASYCLAHGSPLHAQESGGLLSPEQRRAYHACLYAAWVQDYCQGELAGRQRLHRRQWWWTVSSG